jgi:curli biogenesis system outer membrane secretion channel CsgG
MGAVLSIAAILPGAASAAPLKKNASLLYGPPVSDVQSPYSLALECVSRQLTPAQRAVTFTVSSFPDKTNKANFVSDSGVGSFSSQGVEDMLYTSLRLAGVQVTDMSPTQRAMIDWSMKKIGDNAGAPIRVALKLPDVSISGAITTFDVNMSTSGADIRIAGIGLSHQKNRILVGMDARLTEMTGGKRPDGTRMEAGLIPTVVRINKQIIGYAIGAGATRFFGNGGKSTLVDVDLGGNQREAIQYMERIMVDGTAVRLIAQYFGITACDEHIAYGDQLLAPKESSVPASADAEEVTTAPVVVTPASAAPVATPVPVETTPASPPLASPAPITTKPETLATPK